MQSVQNALASLLGEPCRVTEIRPVGGGCISEAMQVRVSVGQSQPRLLFVKRNDATFEDNFQCERLGLEELAQTSAIRVPAAITSGFFASKVLTLRAFSWLEISGCIRL